MKWVIKVLDHKNKVVGFLREGIERDDWKIYNICIATRYKRIKDAKHAAKVLMFTGYKIDFERVEF